MLLGALALLGAAGCEPLGYIQPEPPGPGVLIARRAITSEEDLLARYAAVRRRHPSLAARLDPVAADHREHLRALRGRVVGGATARPTHGSTSSVPSVPAGPDHAVATLVTAERHASKRLLGALESAPGPLAQLLASVSACEATHATLLAPEAPS
ncbi:MAG: hypothetical protein ACRDN9_19255 [Streptosporangiaceae bacterium]